MRYPQTLKVRNTYNISDLLIFALKYDKDKLYLIPPEKVFFLPEKEISQKLDIAEFWEKEGFEYLAFLIKDFDYLTKSSAIKDCRSQSSQSNQSNQSGNSIKEFKQENTDAFYISYLANLPENQETLHIFNVLFLHSKLPYRSNRQKAVNFLAAVKILSSLLQTLMLSQIRKNYRKL